MTIPISDSDRNTYLRDPESGVKLYLAVYRPATTWEGTLDSAPSYPVTTLTVTGTAGNIAFALDGYTCTVESAAGVYRGWFRVRYGSTATALNCMEMGQGYIAFAATDVLKVYPWRRPIAKFHAWSGTVWRPDYNYALSDNHTNIGPLARVGPPAIGWRDPTTGECDLNFVGEYSAAYTASDTLNAAADGWTFPESQTSTTLGTAGSPVTITFDAPHPEGAEFSLYVQETTSGKGHYRYGVLWTFDRTGNNAPYRVAVAGIDSTLGVGGQARVYLYGQFTAAQIPRGAYVALFGDVNYGGTKVTNLGSTYPYRSNVLFAGYVLNEVHTVPLMIGGQMFTEVQLGTVDELLRKANAYPIEQRRVTGTPSVWEEIKNLTVQRGLVSWAKWRANFDMHDVRTGNYGDTAAISYLDLPKGDLWSQLEYLYPNTLMGLVGSSLTSDLYCNADHQVTPSASRWLSSALNLTSTDVGEPGVTIEYDDTQASAQENTSGVMQETPLYSSLPADPMGYFGTVTDQPPGFAPVSQADLNTQTGMLYAKKNARIKRVVIPLAYYAPLDANPQTLVNLTLSAANHPRAFTDFAAGRNLLVTNVRHEYYDEAALGMRTILTCEDEVPASLPVGVTQEPPQEAVVPWDSYAPYSWDFDDAFGDFPVFGDVMDVDSNGEAVVSTNAGIFVTYNLRDAELGASVLWYPMNSGLPAARDCRELVLSASAVESAAWNAIMIVRTGVKATTGLYRNPDLWNPTSTWTLVYSESDYETDVGGTPGYESGQTCYFVDLRSVGAYVYAVTRHLAGSTRTRYIVRSADGGTTWVRGTNPAMTHTSATANAWAGGLGVSAVTGNIYAADESGGNIFIVVSADLGDTWSQLANMGAISTNNEIYEINVPYEGNVGDAFIFCTNGAGNVKRSTTAGASFANLTLPGGFSGRVVRHNLHTYTLDSDILAIASIDNDFAVSVNATQTTPAFTKLTDPGDVTDRMLGGWPNDPNWFLACMANSVVYTVDGGTTWVIAYGNLASQGVTATWGIIPRSIR